MSLISALFISIIGLMSFNTTPNIATKQIDTEASKVEWKGYKVTGSHVGLIKISSGELTFDDTKLTGGKLIIDMNSMTCTDLSGGTADKLIGHLKSDDFFGVATYPTAALTITNVASRGAMGDYKVTADLKIKNTTKQIKFDVMAKDGVAKANVTIDRTDYDVRYGSGSFFDNLGDKTIYDEFEMNIHIIY